MGLILDTSAVIGWLERAAADVVAEIRAHNEIPFVHVVTIGELCEGVERARGAAPGVLASRQATLDFARTELLTVPPPDLAEAAAFGVISAAVGRGLSHNDKWILARTVVDRHLLVTQDRDLAEAARSDVLARSLGHAGHPHPKVTLAAS